MAHASPASQSLPWGGHISFRRWPITRRQASIDVNVSDLGVGWHFAATVDSSWSASVNTRRWGDAASPVCRGSESTQWPRSGWPRVCLSQGEFRAEKGEVERCGAMSPREGVGGVLPAGSGAAPAPQRQLQPGQGLHHETHHQLPAHENSSKCRSVWWKITFKKTKKCCGVAVCQ